MSFGWLLTFPAGMQTERVQLREVLASYSLRQHAGNKAQTRRASGIRCRRQTSMQRSDHPCGDCCACRATILEFHSLESHPYLKLESGVPGKGALRLRQSRKHKDLKGASWSGSLPFESVRCLSRLAEGSRWGISIGLLSWSSLQTLGSCSVVMF